MKKYGRTYHLSFSPEVHSDDKILNPIDEKKLLNQEIIITVKLDGGNGCLKALDGVFARSHSKPTQCPTFDYIKGKHFYPKLGILNPNYWYFGENMYATHSIKYTALTDFFYLFHIYDYVNDIWLSFDEMKQEAERCDFKTVIEIFRGKISSSTELKKILFNNLKKNFFGGEVEGFVIRIADSFKGKDFSKNMGKFVRKGHVQTDEHWSKNWTPNLLLK